MIKVIQGADAHLFPELFHDVFSLRHRVFVKEMGWSDLESPDGLERDQFDNEHAVHHIAIRDGAVVGYQRMLPTTRPHLLSDVLRDMCAGEPPRGDDCWEVSRYCVEPSLREGRRSVGTVGSELIAGTVEWALANDVSRLVYEFEINWLLRAAQLQFYVRPLGLMQQIEKQQVIAAELGISHLTLPAIRNMRAYHAPVLEGLDDEIRLAS